MGAKVRVLIVDDSSLMRQLLARILSSDPEIEVVATAEDPHRARELIKKHNPDVITLDIEMPRMDGLTFLDKIMTLRPMPVVMISSLTQRGADATLRALESGAVGFIGKPTTDPRDRMEAKRDIIAQKVKAAARARVRARGVHAQGDHARGQARAAPRAATGAGEAFDRSLVIGIGASTGGVEALREVLCGFPANCPPIVVTQHMPKSHTARFAARLDAIAQVKVSEAALGARLETGHAYIAPGDRHLEVRRNGLERYRCVLVDGETVSGHKPSVDVLFQSLADCAGDKAIGAILTGMGRDGAKGLLAMRKAGAVTFGQDESSCVVYGMPRAAHDVGAVQRQVKLSKISAEIIAAASSREAAG